MNLYFDNGTTSFPKPVTVAQAMSDFLLSTGGSYGRSSHTSSYTTTTMIEECRDLMGEMLGCDDGSNIAWCKNATEASNVIIRSLDLKGKRVLVSPLEHNCTLRPLVAAGAEIIVMPHGVDGRVDCSRLHEVNHDIALTVINHQSNINGVIQPIHEIADIVSSPVMVDTAQSLGHVDFNVGDLDYVIFTGHKGLLGSTGTGGLYARDTDTLRPLLFGGTGTNSASFYMPSVFPEFIEAGTLNNVGLAGLKAALETPLDDKHTKQDLLDMISALGSIEGVEVKCASDSAWQGHLFSFRHATVDGSIIAHRLSEEFGLATRFGLHCAPLAHQTLGTTGSGLVRVAPSSKFHGRSELEYFVEKVREVLRLA